MAAMLAWGVGTALCCSPPRPHCRPPQQVWLLQRCWQLSTGQEASTASAQPVPRQECQQQRLRDCSQEASALPVLPLLHSRRGWPASLPALQTCQARRPRQHSRSNPPQRVLELPRTHRALPSPRPQQTALALQHHRQQQQQQRSWLAHRRQPCLRSCRSPAGSQKPAQSSRPARRSARPAWTQQLPRCCA